jgi:hypothetical protein
LLQLHRGCTFFPAERAHKRICRFGPSRTTSEGIS